MKLGDFGVAKELQENVNFATTICGTPYYMAPEVTKGQPYGPKADVFALGIALYEMCTFELPFSDESIPGLFDQILNKETPPIGGDFDIETKDIIYKMLTKDPEARPSTFELFHTQFIHERITGWSQNDPKIKAYMEGMINVMPSQRKEVNQRGNKRSNGKLPSKENPNYYCENPNIFISEVMKELPVKTLKTRTWGRNEEVFTGHDLYNIIKRMKGFTKSNEKLVVQFCTF